MDGKGGYEIEFRDVCFKYPSREMPVFLGLNFKIEKNSFVAFVGPTGCGKSTIINLLERYRRLHMLLHVIIFTNLNRFYSVGIGSIHINGKNLDTLDVEAYRRDIALVPQEPMIFKGILCSPSYRVRSDNITLY
jgi:ATP-binding cassette subfamily B (MDR/TAP) protein 1